MNNCIDCRKPIEKKEDGIILPYRQEIYHYTCYLSTNLRKDNLMNNTLEQKTVKTTNWSDFSRPDLKAIPTMLSKGFTIEFHYLDKIRNRTTPENYPLRGVSFKKSIGRNNEFKIWRCRKGWQTAYVTSGKYSNHKYFENVEDITFIDISRPSNHLRYYYNASIIFNNGEIVPIKVHSKFLYPDGYEYSKSENAKCIFTGTTYQQTKGNTLPLNKRG